MTIWKEGKLSRYVVLAAVLALHLALLIGLSRAIQLRLRPSSIGGIISTLIPLQPAIVLRGGPPLARTREQLVTPDRLNNLVIAPIELPTIRVPQAVKAEPPIDWRGAGRKAVSTMTDLERRKFGALSEEGGISTDNSGSSNSAPSYQRGDWFTPEGGGFAVWVSDRCYLLETPPISNVPAQMFLPMTICHNPSKEARAMPRDIARIPLP